MPTRACTYLYGRTAGDIKPGLEVMEALLEDIDHPHRKLAVVHVAGTNGKGSVCAMIEAVLRASGFRTGMFTSPHLVDFSERYRINGEPIPPPKLDGYILSMEEAADRACKAHGLRRATFFEISTGIAFQYFADEAIDIALIEVGMGGRWDATNVVIPLLSVITRIGIDHTEFLGDTLAEIANEKAGIIKPGRAVISAPQEAEAMAVLEAVSEPIIHSAEAVSIARIGAPQKLKIETPSRNLPPISLPLLGACQRENCAVAVSALETLADMLHFKPEFKKGLEQVTWSARFARVSDEPPVVLDSAHNLCGARALVETLNEIYPGYQAGFILGFLTDKDAAGFAYGIKSVLTAAWTIPLDAPRGTTAEESAAKVRAAGAEAHPETVAGAWKAAQIWAANAPRRVIVVAGSLRITEVLVRAGCVSP